MTDMTVDDWADVFTAGHEAVALILDQREPAFSAFPGKLQSPAFVLFTALKAMSDECHAIAQRYE